MGRICRLFFAHAGSDRKRKREGSAKRPHKRFGEEESHMKRKVTYLSVFFAAILLLFAAVRSGIRFYRNQQLISGFEYTENEAWQQYRNELKIETIDFQSYASLFAINMTANARTTHFYLREPLTYYEEHDGKKQPVLTLETGIQMNPGIWEPGYGFFSYPTYEAGWRWVQPFVLEVEAPPENAQLYYVRLEDLTAAARYWFESDDALRKSTVWTGLSCEEAAWEIVNNADVIFYDHGIVLSPDLLSPVWTWDYTAAVLLAAFDLTGLFLLRRTRRA